MTHHNAVVAQPLSRNSPVTAFITSLTRAILHPCGSLQPQRQRQRERVSRAISGRPYQKPSKYLNRIPLLQAQYPSTPKGTTWTPLGRV